MTINIHYHHFATVMANGPATPLLSCTIMVLELSGAEVNRETISDWWHQWQCMRMALKAQMAAKSKNAVTDALRGMPSQYPLDLPSQIIPPPEPPSKPSAN